jgi:hypothetical protein
VVSNLTKRSRSPEKHPAHVDDNKPPKIPRVELQGPLSHTDEEISRWLIAVSQYFPQLMQPLPQQPSAAIPPVVLQNPPPPPADLLSLPLPPVLQAPVNKKAYSTPQFAAFLADIKKSDSKIRLRLLQEGLEGSKISVAEAIAPQAVVKLGSDTLGASWLQLDEKTRAYLHLRAVPATGWESGRFFSEIAATSPADNKKTQPIYILIKASSDPDPDPKTRQIHPHLAARIRLDVRANGDVVCAEIIEIKRRDIAIDNQGNGDKAGRINTLSGNAMMDLTTQMLDALGVPVVWLHDDSTVSLLPNGAGKVSLKFLRALTDKKMPGKTWYGKWGFVAATIADSDDLRRTDPRQSRQRRIVQQGAVWDSSAKAVANYDLALLQKGVVAIFSKTSSSRNIAKAKKMVTWFSDLRKKYSDAKTVGDLLRALDVRQRSDLDPQVSQDARNDLFLMFRLVLLPSQIVAKKDLTDFEKPYAVARKFLGQSEASKKGPLADFWKHVDTMFWIDFFKRDSAFKGSSHSLSSR